MSDVAKIGLPVSDFKMETYDPKTGGFGEFSLASQKEKGRWTVLIFYPADYTFVCPTELADAGSIYQEADKEGVDLVSVSTDNKFVHLAWQREEQLLKGIKFLMGSDTTHAVSKLFGVWDEKTGLAYRGTFIINPDGVLVGSEVNFFNVGRSAQELLRKIKANTYLIDHPEEACPANWSKGQKTLKPGADLVGRVSEALKN